MAEMAGIVSPKYANGFPVHTGIDPTQLLHLSTTRLCGVATNNNKDYRWLHDRTNGCYTHVFKFGISSTPVFALNSSQQKLQFYLIQQNKLLHMESEKLKIFVRYPWF